MKTTLPAPPASTPSNTPTSPATAVDKIPEAGGAVPAPEAGPAVCCIDSRKLFGQARLLHIEHGGQCYVLRITRENRLILTK
ncbi:MAG: hemin uptake protein HemP [Sterolibacterium sp.]|nr:hemin uptake protein HemP [Sterolibacterium sp.]